jgi:hypothetical protein
MGSRVVVVSHHGVVILSSRRGRCRCRIVVFWVFAVVVGSSREVLAVPPLFLQEYGHSGGMKFGREAC